MKTKKDAGSTSDIAPGSPEDYGPEEGKPGEHRSHEQIVRRLKRFHVVVERERDGKDPNIENFKAIWNNGIDPLEIHMLDAKNLHDALLEAEGVKEINPRKELDPSSKSFEGWRGTTANKHPHNPDEKTSAERIAEEPGKKPDQPVYPQPAPSAASAAPVPASHPIHTARPAPVPVP